VDSLLNVSNKQSKKKKKKKEIWTKESQEFKSKRVRELGPDRRPPTYFLIASNLYYSTYLIN